MKGLVIGLCLALLVSTPSHAETAETPRWGEAVLRQDANWYRSTEAVRLAQNVVAYQSPEGGWPKNTDLTVPVHELELGVQNTFDNGATILPMAFLARVAVASGDDAARAAFDRGLDYVLAAQYPNGGWPQFYPLRGDYYDHVTFNDDAMIRILGLLREVSRGAEPYAFVDPARRARARAAVDSGLRLILSTQIRRDGVPAAWCAQYDETTLQPAWARRFEPPSISGSESVGIVRFLMTVEDPGPDVVQAIEGAVAWFEQAAMADRRMETATGPDGKPDRRIVAAPGERLWARFHDIETGRPIYMGRDSVARDRLEDIEAERRNGYAYVGTWAESLLARDYPAWRARPDVARRLTQS